MNRQRQLCVPCVASLFISATLVRCGGDQVMVTAGPKLLEAVTELVDQGHEIELDNVRNVGIYAQATVAGTSLCATHIPFTSWDVLSKLMGR